MNALILAYAAAHPTEARAIFDAAIAAESDPDAVANLEIMREYACNPEFKAGLEAHVFAINADS